MMRYAKAPLSRYAADLSKKMPAPGGGSVAALMLACAAGLVAMASAYTVGKERYRAFGPRARRILTRSLAIQEEALRLLDADVAAYQSKDEARSISVPARVCRLSAETMRLAREVSRKGNRSLRSDADLAVSLARLSATAARSYVRVNVLHLKNSARYAKLLNELKRLS
ncbi:formiminotetrahydrofolate cyclodeaminase [Candidatus Velamenicoccus archaeovorus]|uniref:Formiminotetrahydrofolate cyclodeaminase n=1 Tax=Velamenicoccus archaeovorus TaxID=1930593 RepID=A0A410P2Y1_VELA1|nr:cyclodeaminase/cyclohydrolase family protein [Candidatus Velamenicoccus archaeovorus]QAT16452.1 formiminotetrahydrofolate cyclodeaminase [Candidatus Velamenicoccus archaeovorus]